MKLSRASGCAVAGLVQLARRQDNRLLAAHKIALAAGLSGTFLLRMLRHLTTADLLRSVKGPHGGYRLSRPAQDISLLEVVEAVDGPLRPDAPSLGGPGTEDLDRRLDRVCRQAAEGLRDYLRGVSLADLAGGRESGRKKRS
jgi:Rrf2 family protein